MSPQLVQTPERSSTRSPGLRTLLHATLSSIALNGPPLDMMTQLCSVVAHVDLDIARESLCSIFRAGHVTQSSRQFTA